MFNHIRTALRILRSRLRGQRRPGREVRERSHPRRAGERCFSGLEPLESRLLLSADLMADVTGTGVDGAPYTHGETITATATIVNDGSPRSGPFDIQFWLSREGVTSRYRLIETDRVASIPPFGSRTNVINGGLGYTLPGDLPFGDYHITAYVDTSNEVTESDESNNVGVSNTFRIVGPDLAVSVSGTGPNGAAYSHGDAVTATATIVNEGLRGSGAFDIEFWLSLEGTSSKYSFIERDRVTVGLVPGGVRNNFINGGLGYVLPDTLPFGNYHITAYVDTGNEVNESDETDNVGMSNTFRIVGPDLVVREIAGTGSFYSVGERINATALIANDGDTLTNTGPFTLKYFLSTAENPTFRFIEDGIVLNVLQGVPTTDVINVPGWKIPTDVPQGEYFISVFLDTDDGVKEENESNNVGASDTFIIGQPDLTVPRVAIADTVYSYGDLLSAIAIIENIGLGSTLPQAPLGFNVSFYLGDADAATDTERMRYNLQDALVAWLNGGDQTQDFLNTLLVQPGLYRVWVQADSANKVEESDESNNWGSSDLLVIYGARWEDEAGKAVGDSRLEADPVYLAIYTDQVETYLGIEVDIWEDDTASNDLVESVILEHVGLEQIGVRKWQRRWVPYRTLDGETDPEYFFRVRNADHLPGYASNNLTVVPHPGDFGVLLFEHTAGTGVPLILVHGNESEEAPDLYRWKGMLNWIEASPFVFPNHPDPDYFAEFDVYLWKHDTERAVGFNGAAGSQAAGLADYIYDTLGVGQPGSVYENVKVALVAHSQGGLVSRGFMNTFNPDRGQMQGEDVSTLITLGTPHHGSPFGTEDWVAVLWSDLFNGLNEAGFNKVRTHFLQRGNGDLNLAWDNMDGVVDRAFLAGFLFDPDAYVLTPRDTNSVSNFPDDNVIYLDGLKAQYGTLEALNSTEHYLHKLVTIGAYDADLSDNMSAQELSNALLFNQELSRHEQLSAVANLMAKMSGAQLGNHNPSDYIANDGLVPLQSALLLELPYSGLSIAVKDAQERVTLIPDEQIAAVTPRDVLRFIYSTADGIQDHVDLLDTTNSAHWTTISQRLRAVLEAIPPTTTLVDPGDGESIPLALLNGRGYLDIAFSDAGGSTLDPTSILDAGAEFFLTGSAAAGVVVNGAPMRLAGDDHVYRYSFTGAFTTGTVTVEFIAGSFADDAGNLSDAQSNRFRAGEVTNQPPTVQADSSAVTAQEGQVVENAGTHSDPDGGGVTLTASVGTIIDNGDGTWAWSLATTDGPDDSQTVTIRATDGGGASAETTFDLTVNNVAPTVDAGGPYVVVQGHGIQLNGSALDPAGLEDTLTFTWDLDGDGVFGESGPAAERGHEVGQSPTFDSTGMMPGAPFLVVMRATDHDGGVGEDTAAIHIRLEARDSIVNDGSAQRSNIEQLQVVFNQDTNIQALIDSGQVVNAASLFDGNGQPFPLDVSRYSYDSASATLTIDLTIDGFGLSRTTMLADGGYELRLDTSMITAAGNPANSLFDGDDAADGFYRFAFHRLLGDFDGDGDIAGKRGQGQSSDRVLLAHHMGSHEGEPGYDVSFDLNGDGRITGRDMRNLNSRGKRRL